MRRAGPAALCLLVFAALATPAQAGRTAPRSPLLSVRVSGNGTVTSSPAGIDCPSDCSESYPRSAAGVPQTVQLAVKPGAGQVLQGWGGSCSGNGPCSVVMDAGKIVTAGFGPAPPPSTEPTGTLTVEPTAGGTVAGVAGAIACPPDCTETLPLGAPFDLTPTALSGFVFDHWDGQCTGAGACSGTVAAATYVKAVFAAVPPKARPAATDSDGDGVRDAADACPGTAKGVKVKADGCAVLDVVRDPGGTLDPLRGDLATARLGLRFVPGAQPVVRQLTAIAKLLDSGQGLVGSGDACGAAGRLKSAATQLRKAGSTSASLMKNLETSVFATRLPPGFGDTAEKDIQVAELNYRQRLLDAAIASGADASRAFGDTCKAFGTKRVVRGVVKSTDDETGLARLDTGDQVLFPRGDLANRVYEGAFVQVTGSSSGKGPVLAEKVADLASVPREPLTVVPCMNLRIAPVQDFTVANPVLHDPGGYRKNGVHLLEAGMRLAASPKCSSGKGRYSLAIELVDGASTSTLAADLDASDPPVPLAGPLNKIVTLRVRERRQGSDCPPPGPTPSGRAAKVFPCPVVEKSVTDYKIRIRPLGYFGTAVYNRTTFALDVDAPQFVTVTGLTDTHGSVPPSATFEGDGYDTTATVNTGHYVKLVQGDQWTLYPKELYGFTSDVLFPLDTFGVDHFAGVLWPRVVGKRNSKPFRYAALLPEIITDVLAFCPGQGEDCYYAAPWPYLVEKDVGQGNGPGAFSHNGAQQYAFDFSLLNGDEIDAARGGIVGDVVENLTANYNPCGSDPNVDGLGNYVRIDHQDGTYAYYVHLKTNTSPLTVGEEISRGEMVAQADNTGRSCGPHLHFQVSTVSNQLYYGQTTEILFDTLVKGQASPYSQPCYLPKSGDTLISTNG